VIEIVECDRKGNACSTCTCSSQSKVLEIQMATSDHHPMHVFRLCKSCAAEMVMKLKRAAGIF
jgi:hypothetical protein